MQKVKTRSTWEVGWGGKWKPSADQCDAEGEYEEHNHGHQLELVVDEG